MPILAAMITGFEFKRRLELAWDNAYSGYYDDTKLNRLIDRSFYNIVERDYRGLQTQKQYDEITNLIKTGIPVTLRDNILHTSYLPITNVSTNGTTVTVTTARPHYIDVADNITIANVSGITVTLINGDFQVTGVPSATTFTYDSVGSVLTAYSAGSGYVETDGYMLSDYFHYLAIKTYSSSTYSANVTNVVSNFTSTYTDVTCSNHNVRKGDTITITNVSGIFAANGTFTPDQYTIINKNVIRLLFFAAGAYTNGGVVNVVVDEWAAPFVSDTKISTLNTPTPRAPRVETARGTLKFYPSTISSVEVDYMTKLPYTIDVTRTADDLTLYYSDKFLELLITECVLQASAETRDDRRYSSSMQDLQMNP